jgi:hypothetical protein
VGLKPELENIVYSESRLKKDLQFFANMTPKIFFSQHFEMGVQNPEFEADFKSVKKSVQKFLQKKLLA